MTTQIEPGMIVKVVKPEKGPSWTDEMESYHIAGRVFKVNAIKLNGRGWVCVAHRFLEATLALDLRLLQPATADEQAYYYLIQEVKEIDKEAAKYMECEAHKLENFEYSGDIGRCFLWHETPHGYDLWNNIDWKLCRKRKRASKRVKQETVLDERTAHAIKDKDRAVNIDKPITQEITPSILPDLKEGMEVSNRAALDDPCCVRYAISIMPKSLSPLSRVHLVSLKTHRSHALFLRDFVNRYYRVLSPDEMAPTEDPDAAMCARDEIEEEFVPAITQEPKGQPWYLRIAAMDAKLRV